ncbi:MAG: O-succinylhomoserine sulfhydrylase [Pseudomonadota bacterium]
MTDPEWSLESQLIHDTPGRSQYGETAEPIYATSGFTYESAEQAVGRFNGDIPGYVYSRYANPTVSIFERRMAAIEGTEVCFGTASGMAAIFGALACQVRAGDHIVAGRVLFGSCLQILTTILPRWGVEATLVDAADNAAWSAAVRPNTKVFFCESPANPTLELADLGHIGALAKQAGASFVMDNIFAAPFIQRPVDFGADVIVYSGTKHIDGQGRVMGGAICCSQAFLDETLLHFMRHTGPTMSPFNAWTLGKSLETLKLRLDRMAANAAQVAAFLEGHKAIAQALYPGLASHPQKALADEQMTNGGTMLAFDLKGGQPAAFSMLNALKLIRISNNLGDAKSLATHPATTTHRVVPPEDRAAIGIGDGLVRLSVGLEDPTDIIRDLDRALAA